MEVRRCTLYVIHAKEGIQAIETDPGFRVRARKDKTEGLTGRTQDWIPGRSQEGQDEERDWRTRRAPSTEGHGEGIRFEDQAVDFLPAIQSESVPFYGKSRQKTFNAAKGNSIPPGVYLHCALGESILNAKRALYYEFRNT